MTDIDTDVATRRDRRSRRHARTWTFAGTAVAATVAVVMLVPAPLASAAPAPTGVPVFGIPCQSQVQAFYNAKQAVADHNAEWSADPEPEQAEIYNAQGEALYATEVQARDAAETCMQALAGRAAPTLPDPIPHTATQNQAPGGPSESGDWAEKMQDKIYDWFKENLERVEKYQEKQQEEREKQQEEQRREQGQCDQSQAPASTPPAASAVTPIPAPPICPAAPTTTAPSGTSS